MTSVTNAPRLSPSTAEQLAADLFGIEGRATPLPSERDQNFRIQSPDGRWFVLKIANPAEDPAMLDAENAAIRHLARTALVPALVTARSGGDIARYEHYFVRLISGLAGKPLAETPRHTDALLADLGRAVGQIDRALASFDHPALHRDFYWDLATAPDVIARYLPRVERRRDARCHRVRRSASIRRTVVPRLPTLRRSVIHGDVNDFNVLVDARTERVTGIVDFGDMVFSHTVNDAAIAMAYAALDKADPLGAAAHRGGRISRGECAQRGRDRGAVRPDADAPGVERVRGGPSAGRAARTASTSGSARRRSTGRCRCSQASIRGLRTTGCAMRCGLVPVPHAPRVVAWLRSQAAALAPLTGHDLKTAPVLGLDMSAGSTLVASNPADNAAEPFSRRVFAAMEKAGAVAGVGGYDEARLIYATDAYATGPVTAERRTVHIGIDVTMPAGTPLYAPLDGVVHGFENAAARLDYGPVIVLRHEIPGDEAATFYTLYGHLDPRVAPGAPCRQANQGRRAIRRDWRASRERRLVAARARPGHHGHARRAVQLQRRRARKPAPHLAQHFAGHESDSRDSPGALRAPSVNGGAAARPGTSASAATSACRTAAGRCRLSAAGCSTCSTRPAGRSSTRTTTCRTSGTRIRA